MPGIRQLPEKGHPDQTRQRDIPSTRSANDIGKLPDKNIADARPSASCPASTSRARPAAKVVSTRPIGSRPAAPRPASPASLSTATTCQPATGSSSTNISWSAAASASPCCPRKSSRTLTIYKTQDPSILEGGVSGVVDIQTRNPLNLAKEFTFEASAAAAYNTNAGPARQPWQPQFNGLLGWKNADDTFGVIPFRASTRSAASFRYGQETLGYTNDQRHGIGHSRHINDPFVPGTGMPIRQENPTLNGVQAPTLIGSSLFEQQRTRASRRRPDRCNGSRRMTMPSWNLELDLTLSVNADNSQRHVTWIPLTQTNSPRMCPRATRSRTTHWFQPSGRRCPRPGQTLHSRLAAQASGRSHRRQHHQAG